MYKTTRLLTKIVCPLFHVLIINFVTHTHKHSISLSVSLCVCVYMYVCVYVYIYIYMISLFYMLPILFPYSFSLFQIDSQTPKLYPSIHLFIHFVFVILFLVVCITFLQFNPFIFIRYGLVFNFPSCSIHICLAGCN